MITDDGKAQLADFGLAVIVEDLKDVSLSSSLRNAGSARWMAPELLLDDYPVSKESDIWAFGMVCLEVNHNFIILSS